MTINDNMISYKDWCNAWYWYRSAPHQVEAVVELYDAIAQEDPCLLNKNASWFRRYQDRDQLVHSAMFTDGE